MDAPDFRDRISDTAARVLERTGVDPLDLAASMAVTTDARLERLPQSVGFGLAAMAVAIALMCAGFLADPGGGPGYAVTGAFVVVDVLLLGGAVACGLAAAVARGRRLDNERYEDAWARFAVEIWPAPRYQSWDGTPGTSAAYSRTEFLMAVRDERSLDLYRRHAPFTAMP